jgi:hypothetical protein
MVVAGDVDNTWWEKRKMKKHLAIVLFGIAAFSLTGCYTQIAVQGNDDSYVYNELIPIIIYYPVPDPILVPIPPAQAPPYYPVQPIKKIKKPETPPPNKDRIRDDIRNSGGRNDSGKRARR